MPISKSGLYLIMRQRFRDTSNELNDQLKEELDRLIKSDELLRAFVKESPYESNDYGDEFCWFCNGEFIVPHNFIHKPECIYRLAKIHVEEGE